jgi:hypothetical protein
MKIVKIRSGLKYLACWVMLLQLINLSIDPATHQNFVNGAITYQDDLSLNKIESLSELILENIFKKDIPETQSATNHALAKTFIVFHQNPPLTTTIVFIAQPIVHNHTYQVNYPKPYQVLESPPPQLTV